MRARVRGLISVLSIAVLAFVAAGCGAPAASTADREGGAAPVGALGAGGLGDPWGPWQTEPIAIPGNLLAKIDAACRTSMQPFPAVPLVAVDARGEGLVQAQFAGPGGQATCMDMTLGRDGTVTAMGGGSTGVGPQPAGPRPLELQGHGSMGSGGGPNGEITRSVLLGRAGEGIARVAIEVPGRGVMTASLQNGWYIASFPDEWPQGTRVVAYDATGTEVATATP